MCLNHWLELYIFYYYTSNKARAFVHAGFNISFIWLIYLFGEG